MVNKSDNLKIDSIRTVGEGFAGDPEGVELNFTCKSHAIKSDWIKVSNICLCTKSAGGEADDMSRQMIGK